MLRGLILVSVLAFADGCVGVAAYQRERLSRPDMDSTRLRAGAEGEDHAREYREGSTPVGGGSAGGCGCN